MPSHRMISGSPSRLSKCPRSSSTSSQCELLFPSRSWRNSWWKYLRLSPFYFVVTDCGAERGHSSSAWWCAPSSRFSPGQGSTTLPSTHERISERNVEQIVDFPGGLQDFLPRHGSTASSSSSHGSTWCRGRAVSSGFSHFSLAERSAKLGLHSGSELSADFISSTPSACERGHFSEDGNFFFEEDQKTWDAVALWPGVPSAQRARRVQGRSKGSGVKLLFINSWSAGSGECVFSLVHPLNRRSRQLLGDWGRALVMRQSTEAF